MTSFSSSWLQKQGLNGPATQLTTSAEQREDELDIRVGMVLMDKLTDDQVAEFEAIGQQADADEDELRAASDKAAFIGKLQGADL